MLNAAGNKPPYIGFGFAGIGTALSLQIPNLLLLVYMTDTLAISAALAGAALFAPRLLDVVTDPLMGLLSDRTKSRWGRPPALFVLGALVTSLRWRCCSTARTSSPSPPGWPMWWAFTSSCNWGVTIFMVPYYALPAELSSDPHERTKLMSSRAVVLLLRRPVGAAPWRRNSSRWAAVGRRLLHDVRRHRLHLRRRLRLRFLRHTQGAPYRGGNNGPAHHRAVQGGARQPAIPNLYAQFHRLPVQLRLLRRLHSLLRRATFLAKMQFSVRSGCR